YLLTALALYLKQIWLVFLGYGVIGGIGTHLRYIFATLVQSPLSSSGFPTDAGWLPVLLVGSPNTSNNFVVNGMRSDGSLATDNEPSDNQNFQLSIDEVNGNETKGGKQ
ncbi:unnamed protein product, partial [Allacma fusca]